MNLSTSSDEELMASYVAGDAVAFRELFDRYGARLLRLLSRDLGSREEAEDLVQQTFLHLHRARHDFDGTKRLRPFLYTIALNLKREHLRRKRRRPEHALELESLPGRSGGASHVEATRDLHRALSALSVEQREVIELHWFGDVDFKEIAEIVGASLTAVKVRAHRGYGKLRAILAEDPGRTIRGNSLPMPSIPSGRADEDRDGGGELR